MYIVETSGKEHFVRLYRNPKGKVGQWIAKYDDIKRLTPKQIQEKFALPDTPTHIADVDVPKGTRLRAGTVNPIEGWGNGDGQQFDFIGNYIDRELFTNERKL